MLEIEIKNNDGRYKTGVSKNSCDAAVIFYLYKNKISMDIVGVTDIDFIKTLKKELPKVIDKAIAEQTLKVKKENK